MSQNQTFNIPDSQATPVNYVFTPVSTSDGIAMYRADRGHNALPAGAAGLVSVRPVISGSIRQHSMGDASTRRGRVKRRVTLKVVVPDCWASGLLGIDEAPVFDTLEATLTLSVPGDATSRSVTDMKALLGALLSTTPIAEMVDGEFPY